MNIRGRNKVSSEFSMSSMTDIVFLLLIFFMLTSTLVTTEALDLLLPSSKSSNATEKEIVSVSIKKGRIFYINKQNVPFNYLERRLKKILKGKTNPRISIRAEESVPIQDVVDVMSIASRNNYKAILAVKTSK